MFGRLSAWWHGNKTTLTPSLTGDESTSENQNALSQFTDLLDNEKKKITSLMNEWIQHKQDVIAGGPALPEHKHPSGCSIETHEKVQSVVMLALAKIKGFFQSAKANLTEQIKNEVSEHIKPLRHHIDALCKQANDKTKSPEERRAIVVHICNASMILLRELEGLADNVAQEIKYCLEAEKRGEEVAKIAINAGLFFLAGIIGVVLPPVDFNLEEPYQNFLGNSIQDPEDKFIREITKDEGELKKADSIVENYTISRRGSGGIFSQPTLAPAGETEVPAPAPITTLMIRPQ